MSVSWTSLFPGAFSSEIFSLLGHVCIRARCNYYWANNLISTSQVNASCIRLREIYIPLIGF